MRTRIIGRYGLHRQIAAGGMAAVHLGRLRGSVGFSRIVAIKRLHSQYAADPEFVSMFLDEARLTGRIRHPNVVPTLDVVAMDGELFIVMEYVPGESLSRLERLLRDRQEQIEPRLAAAILVGTLHGLHAAHEATDEQGVSLNIVHRDVSPQNILVGTDGVARVLDFGIAKARGRHAETRDGQLKGKLAYMAPEQLRGEAVTEKTDVYAASIVLWELLTGQRLFRGDNEAETLTNILVAPVPKPSQFAPNAAALDDVVMRGLARTPSARYPSAREMAVAIEQVVTLPNPSELGDWVRRVASRALLERADMLREAESEMEDDTNANAVDSPVSGRRGASSARSLLDGMQGAQGADEETKPNPADPDVEPSALHPTATTITQVARRGRRVGVAVGVIGILIGIGVAVGVGRSSSSTTTAPPAILPVGATETAQPAISIDSNTNGAGRALAPVASASGSTTAPAQITSAHGTTHAKPGATTMDPAAAARRAGSTTATPRPGGKPAASGGTGKFDPLESRE